MTSFRFGRRAFTAGTLASLWSVRPARAWVDADWALPARNLCGTRATLWPLSSLRERWRVTVAGGVTGAALVLDDTVVAASMGGEVVAIELASGRERWRRMLGTASYTGSDGPRALGFFAGAAAARGRIVLASDRVHCLDAQSGDTLWSSPPLRTQDSDDYFWGGVGIVGDLVLAGSGSGGETPTARGRLSAYDLRDGAARWSTPMVDEGAYGGGILAPATVDPLRGRIYVSTGAPYADDGTPIRGASSLVELSLDGRVVHRDALPAGQVAGLDLNSAPLLLGRLALATAKDGVWAWDRIARRRLWHVQLTPSSSAAGQASGPSDGPEGGPIASDGWQVYVLSNDGAAGTFTAAALRPGTGEVLWRRELPGYTFAAPALAGGVLYTASAAGSLHALRCADGEPLAEAPLGAPSAGAVSSARGHVLVGVGAAPYLPGDELLCFA
jgi:outer membrane protein assembly factor BamB